MKEKINRHITVRDIALWVIGYFFVMLIISMSYSVYEKAVFVIRDNTPAEGIWTYYSIRASGTPRVGDSLYFTAHRTSNGTYPIEMQDTLRCGDEYVVTFVDNFTFKEGELKGRRFRFGIEEDWVPLSEGKDCYLESCQYLDYYGITKSQCFESERFDILPKK